MKRSFPSVKKKALERIAFLGSVSKAELMDHLNLTSSSMTRLLDELIGDGLILESGRGDSTGGRKPILYQARPESGYFFGLDISRIHSRLGLFDMQFRPLSIHSWKMDLEMVPDRFIQHVTRLVKSMVGETGLTNERILGLGIGAVGPLNSELGLILEPLYFPAAGWTNLNICSLLTEATGIPAYLDNGANAALIGEHWAVHEDNVNHMLYVHTGVGLRSAMMTNGHLVRGAVDMEGSIGQMIIQTDGSRLEEGGNFGALEAYASIPALEKQLRSRLKIGSKSLLNELCPSPDLLSFDMILEALTLGDPLTRQHYEHAASYFGIGLANLINTLHPERIVLGGPLIASDESFFTLAVGIARKNIYYYPQYSPTFTKGNLKEDSVVTGAAILAFKQRLF